MGASSERVQATGFSRPDHGHASWRRGLERTDPGSTCSPRDLGSSRFTSGRATFSSVGPTSRSTCRACGSARTFLGCSCSSRADVGFALGASFGSCRQSTYMGIGCASVSARCSRTRLGSALKLACRF